VNYKMLKFSRQAKSASSAPFPISPSQSRQGHGKSSAWRGFYAILP
jgi:hypothetical protein